MMRKTSLTGILGLILTVATMAQGEPPRGKLLEFGWDMPSIPYVAKHVREMEKMPFDGVMLSPGMRVGEKGERISLGMAWTFWQAEPITPEMRKYVEEDIDLLAKTKFTKMTEIFLQVNSHPGGLDWFDEKAFANVLDNWRLMAKAVKKSGARGIFFDNEYYAKRQGPAWRPCVWQYDVQPQKDKHTFEEYQKQLFAKARQIMAILQAENPKIVLLMPFADSLLAKVNKADLKTHRYGMFPAFLDGLMAEAGKDVTIIDGYENAYGYRAAEEFRKTRNFVLKDSASMSRNPGLYRRKINVSYGLFIDHIQRYNWYPNPKQFDKNYYLPDELAYTVYHGLMRGTYVWIYTQKINWWTGQFRPDAYVKALEQARHGKEPVRPPLRDVKRSDEGPLD